MLGFVGFVGNAVDQLAVLQLFHLFWFFAFWPFLAMLVDGVRETLGYGEERTDPRDWLEMDAGWTASLAFLVGLPLSVLNPLMFRQDAMQLLGSVVAIARNRGSLPGPETYTPSASYRLPVEGTWTIVNGSPIKEYSHSWFPATQRYAYDFVVTDDDGRTRPADTDTSVENYYCYDRPVLAPADGTVVDVGDGDPELRRAGGFSHPFKRSITGNHVTIRHARGEYSSLVHLVPGSVRVAPGQRVERGERIGRCGHSGNSSEPHLHFQLQDHPAFEVAAGLPVAFEDVDVEVPGTDVVEATGWEAPERGPAGQYVHVGQRVTHAPGGDPHPGQGDARIDPSGATSTPALGRVITLGTLAKGIAVGGLLTVLAGVLVPSLAAIAIGLAGVAGVAGLYHLGQRLRIGDRSRSRSIVTAGGAGLAAALVGTVAVASPISPASPFTVGGGLFLLGFLLFTAVWEYERLSPFRTGVRTTLTK